ncbi:hypothetical protein HYC85_020416 [Camellia sinensis]|uniref:Uncharacterized protein n=1 Tax=Camellia sinensis TaxID=4442 RepID=A0A7J7GTI8_CAMSI|nr:hypothetical protein HYC85_020416 [Camellia sinensis]
MVVQLQARLSAVEQQTPHTPQSEHASSNTLRNGDGGNFQPDFLSTKNKVRTKDGIPPQAKIIKRKCSNTLKSDDKGNFQLDCVSQDNRLRTKYNIPPQDPKQNKRKVCSFYMLMLLYFLILLVIFLVVPLLTLCVIGQTV